MNPVLQAAGLTLGAALVAAGLSVHLGGRRLARAGRTARLSPPTRMTLGLVLVVLGYHAAAWALPPTWLPLRVPPDRWWLVVGGAAAALLGTALAERLER